MPLMSWTVNPDRWPTSLVGWVQPIKPSVKSVDVVTVAAATPVATNTSPLGNAV